MAFQPAPGVAKVTMEYTQFGDTFVNTYHVKTEENWALEFLEGLVAIFWAWFQDEQADSISNTVTLSRIVARDLSTEFAAFLEFSPIAGNVGEKTSPAMPGNVTAVVSWGSGLTGRSTRGRTYVVGLTEEDVTGNELTSGARTAINTDYAQLRNNINGGDINWSMAVLSRVQNGVPLAEAIAYQITSVATDQFIDSMRKRLAGRGA